MICAASVRWTIRLRVQSIADYVTRSLMIEVVIEHFAVTLIIVKIYQSFTYCILNGKLRYKNLNTALFLVGN